MTDMNQMPKIAVMLSVYNGSRYLKEQLDSIFAQKDVAVTLFVRDDGSSDESVKIIRDYASSLGTGRLVLKEGINVGASRSFFELLYDTPDCFDYYAFCDQDDIWLDIKLSEAIRVLLDNKKQVYCSNQTLVNARGEYLREHYTETLDVSLMEEVQENRVTGCTVVFTADFFKLITSPERRPSESFKEFQLHDMWIGLVGALTDSLVYDDRSFIHYRQHENNVVGIRRMSRPQYLMQAIKKIPQKSVRNTRSKRAKELVARYPDYAENKRLLTACAAPESLKNKMVLIKNYPVFKKHTGRCAFTIAVLFNFF